MSELRIFSWIFLCFFLPSLIANATTHHKKPPVSSEARDITVWVNTSTGVFHMPGTRWYKHTRHGMLMSERKALAKGYRPSFNGQ